MLKEPRTSNYITLVTQPQPLDNTFLTVSPSTAAVTLGPCSVDANMSQKRLTSALISAYDAAAPLRKITLSSKRIPWVSPAILALMKQRDKVYNLACTTGLSRYVEGFKALRSSVSNMLDTAKKSYIAGRISSAPDAE